LPSLADPVSRNRALSRMCELEASIHQPKEEMVMLAVGLMFIVSSAAGLVILSRDT
jgi:hypothetical protein